jgi:hypothetical protein
MDLHRKLLPRRGTRILMRAILIGFLLLLAASAHGTETPTIKCAKAEAVEAEKEADSLSDWDQIYQSYKRFSQCDDGAIAEGYSDSITKLLADDWKSVGRLLALTNQNKNFRTFVLKHIDETVPGERLKKIVKNARSECVSGAETLCLSIAKAAGK